MPQADVMHPRWHASTVQDVARRSRLIAAVVPALDSPGQAFIGRRPDGIVPIGVDHSRQARSPLMGWGAPVVETWDLTPTPVDMVVGFSQPNVGTAVCDFLTDLAPVLRPTTLGSACATKKP